jgi:carbon monoxide dehydrogenase subunit G
MKQEESIDIATPPENIWPLLTKRENVFAVDPLVKRFDFVGEQHSGVGTTFYMEKKTDGRLIRSLCTFTEWEENKKLAFHQFLGGDVKRMYVAYTIEPIEGGTRLTLVHEVVMPYCIIGKIVELLVVQPVMKKVGPEVVANIKRLAEA